MQYTDEDDDIFSDLPDIVNVDVNIDMYDDPNTNFPAPIPQNMTLLNGDLCFDDATIGGDYMLTTLPMFTGSTSVSSPRPTVGPGHRLYREIDRYRKKKPNRHVRSGPTYLTRSRAAKERLRNPSGCFMTA